jgi:hypothetical protein
MPGMIPPGARCAVSPHFKSWETVRRLIAQFPVYRMPSSSLAPVNEEPGRSDMRPSCHARMGSARAGPTNRKYSIRRHGVSMLTL